MEAKMTFEQAVKECNGIPLDEFIAELHRRVDAYFDKKEAEERAAKATKARPRKIIEVRPHA